jgi:hypothetical protein
MVLQNLDDPGIRTREALNIRVVHVFWKESDCVPSGIISPFTSAIAIIIIS